MIDFEAQARAVREQYVRGAYTDKIKALVCQQLNDIDSRVVVDDTGYFNHSAIPDFVVTWPGERQKRDFFLRSSYASIVAADDISRTASSPSVFLALDDRQQFNDEWPRIGRQQISDEAQRSRSALVTDVAAVDQIGRAEADEETSPMARLVRENFVRGGRGWVDEQRATHLVDASNQGPGGLIELVRENFDEPAALRLERTAALIDAALGPEGDAVLAIERALAFARGSLSVDELRTLIPWLLKHLPSDRSEQFWGILAPLVGFEELQEVSAYLDQQDITALVLPNLSRWSARRAYLGLAVEGTDQGVWRFSGGLLGLDVGDMRVAFAADNRKLRGRDSSASPTWEELSEPLASFKLSSVTLRGITRSVRIDAQQSDDIRQDVQEVARSLSDSYHVTDVAVTFANPDEDGTVEAVIEFGKSLATAPSGVHLRDLARAALKLLNFRGAWSDDQVNEIIQAGMLDIQLRSES